MKESQAIDALGALAHETRLRIVRHLVKCGESGSSAGEIGNAVAAAPSKVSFHIAALERAGIADPEKVSRQIIYRLNFERMGALLNYLLSDCCKNDPAVITCCEIGTIKKKSTKK